MGGSPQKICLVLQVLLSTVLSFQIIKKTQTASVVEPGGRVRLLCQADNYYEYCSWRHTNTPYNLNKGVRECHFEWKRKHGAVRRQACDSALQHSVTLTGNYERHECGIIITGAQLQDAGQWTCEMEKYVLGGSRGSGTTRTKVFSLEVVPPTTTTTTTTTTVAYEDDDGHYDYVEEDSDEEEQDESYEEEEEEEDDSDEDDHEEEEYLEYDATTTMAAPSTIVSMDTTTSFNPTYTSWHPNQEQRGDTGPEYPEYQEYPDHSDNSTAELDYAESSRLQVEEVRDVTLQEEDTSAVSIVGVVCGLLVALVAAGGVVAALLVWRRRRRSEAVVTMSKILEDSEARGSILEQAEVSTSLA